MTVGRRRGTIRAKARGASKYGEMNRWEKDFSIWLDKQDWVDAWKFESVKLKLAAKTFYTPDFLVIKTSGEVVFYEVKGYWRDDARVKIKVAAKTYPEFVFEGVTKRPKREGGGWGFEKFHPPGWIVKDPEGEEM